MSDDILTPEEIAERISKKADVSSIRIQIRCEGVKKCGNKNLWLTINRGTLRDAVKELMEISYPHLSCISGFDEGADSKNLRVQYNFSIYGGVPKNETMVILSLDVPKEDAWLPTITDMMEGTAFTEHEKTEYLGIEIRGLSKAHRFFLPEDFPENVYPLRKDDKKIPNSMVNDLWASGRPKRDNPPLAEKKDIKEAEIHQGGVN